MQIHPTRSAVDLAVAGIFVVGVGVVTTQPTITAWGSAMLIGLAVARAVTLVSVTRIRTAGFEMLWRGSARLVRVARGQSVELLAEVRNRDNRAARYVALRPIGSPSLSLDVNPSAGEVPASGRLEVTVRVQAPRVGHHGVYGLSLEVQGSPGLFEVPLTFANPYGIDVVPAPYGVSLRSARGGRSRSAADVGRPGPVSGDGLELREIRERQPGDPFKRIAWKASARRGRLMVRDYERDERDVVWLVLDASVELWAGPAGRAPLDRAIDEVAAVALAHLSRGDRVGLAVCGARPLAWIVPGRGPGHTAKLMQTLVEATWTYDADRSDLDDDDVAARVVEHLRPLEPEALSRLRPKDADGLPRLAARVARRAPFARAEIRGPSPSSCTLRGYLAAFGIHSPPRLEPDRPKSDPVLADLLARTFHSKPRASLVLLWSPPPDPGSRSVVAEALQGRPRRALDVRWVRMHLDESVLPNDSVDRAVRDAILMRTLIAESRGERLLRQMGIRVERMHRRATTKPEGPLDPPEPPAVR